MNKFIAGALLASTVLTATLAIEAPANAYGISIDFGNVAFGYRDGYWDRGHQWHHWRNRDEANGYRNAPGSHYNDYGHNRDRDHGWHQ